MAPPACGWPPVFEIIIKGKRKPATWNTKRHARWKSECRDQAVRVSWRIIKDWVEAQMALVETKIVTTAQVFLPYVVLRDGHILAEEIAKNPTFLLGDGEN